MRMWHETNSVGAENVESLAASHDVEEQKGVDCGVSLQRRKNRDQRSRDSQLYIICCTVVTAFVGLDLVLASDK